MNKKVCMVVKHKVLEIPLESEDLFLGIDPEVSNLVFEESNEYYYYDPNRIKPPKRVSDIDLHGVLKVMLNLSKQETLENLQFELCSSIYPRTEVAKKAYDKLTNKLEEVAADDRDCMEHSLFENANRHLVAGVKMIARANRDYLVRESGYNVAYGIDTEIGKGR